MVYYNHKKEKETIKMKRWVTCPADVERYVRDERERPHDYEEHFYPCYIEYEQSWDSHFCGNYYFMNKTKEEAIAMRKKSLLEYIQEKNKEINAAIFALEKLDE